MSEKIANILVRRETKKELIKRKEKAEKELRKHYPTLRLTWDAFLLGEIEIKVYEVTDDGKKFLSELRKRL